MKRGFSLRLRLYLLSAVPGLLTAMLIVLGASNFQLSGISEFIPSFAVMAIFFWAIYVPKFMPQWFCLLLGIFQDAINGTVLGQSAVINLILWGIIYSQRRFLIKESFPVLYGIFIITSLAASGLQWLIFCLVTAKIFFSISILIQWFFTATFYPVIHLIFSRIYLAMVKNFRYVGWR